MRTPQRAKFLYAGDARGMIQVHVLALIAFIDIHWLLDSSLDAARCNDRGHCLEVWKKNVLSGIII